MKLPQYIAHRGAASCAPENTVASMQRAKALGATWVEFDVQLTKDEAVVVIHDEQVDRTTNGTGKVNAFLLQDVLALDAGSYFDAKFSKESIPEFSAFLKTLGTLGLNSNVELKASVGHEDVLCRKVLDALQSLWPANFEPPILSSFNPVIIETLKKLQCPYPIAILLHHWDDRWLAFAQDIKPVSVNVRAEVLTAARVKAIKQAGYGLLSYTVNTLEKADELFAWGVDGIFTDRIGLFTGINE